MALASIALSLLVAARGLERLNTWYLASDQFAFLTLASDLREGRITREDSFYDYIGGREQRAFDAYAQTYRIREGRLHSRYPPGFPALLAVAGALFGEIGEHALNPLLYLLLLVVLARLGHLVVVGEGAVIALGVAAAIPWLVLLLPTDVHLWGITVARDLPTHLLCLLAMGAAVRGRFGAAGFALGLAAVIRPDAVLYVVSLGAIAAVRGGIPRAVLQGAVGFLAGSWPLFVYNWVTLGHPLSFTQGSELSYFLSALPSFVDTAWAAPLPAGGGLRVAHFAQTMRGNLALLSGSFGWFALAIIPAVLRGWRRTPLLVAAFVPYAVVATIFYGFWGHPDPRYLVGVSLCGIVLVAAGLVFTAERVAGSGAGAAWRIGVGLVAVLALVALLLAGGRSVVPAPGAGATVVTFALVLLSLLSRGTPGAPLLRPLAPLAVPVVLLSLALWSVWEGPAYRDPYSRAQIERARTIVEATVPPGSIVLTSAKLGRPAENITHYTAARAAYLGELSLAAGSAARVAAFHLGKERRVFLLLPPGPAVRGVRLPRLMRTRFRKHIGSDEGLDWFLNPTRARQGATLYEVVYDWPRLTPTERRGLEALGLRP